MNTQQSSTTLRTYTRRVILWKRNLLLRSFPPPFLFWKTLTCRSFRLQRELNLHRSAAAVVHVRANVSGAGGSGAGRGAGREGELPARRWRGGRGGPSGRQGGRERGRPRPAQTVLLQAGNLTRASYGRSGISTPCYQPGGISVYNGRWGDAFSVGGRRGCGCIDASGDAAGVWQKEWERWPRVLVWQSYRLGEVDQAFVSVLVDLPLLLKINQ